MAGGELFGHVHSVRAFVGQVKHSFVKQMFDRLLTTNSCSCHATNSRSSNMCSIGTRVFIKKGVHQIAATTNRNHERAVMAIAVVIPGQFGDRRPISQVYARRRLMAVLTVFAIVLVLLVGAGHVVANRGGAPASASAIRPVSARVATAPAVRTIYIVQAGDTLWSIGQRFRGHTALADYVDELVSANGGTHLQIAQPLALP